LPPKLPIKARVRLEHTKYGPAAQVAVTLGVTEYDVQVNTGVSADALLFVDVAPMVTLNWLTTYGVEPLPGETDFKKGFRVLFGAPAPSGAKLNYSMVVLE